MQIGSQLNMPGSADSVPSGAHQTPAGTSSDESFERVVKAGAARSVSKSDADRIPDRLLDGSQDNPMRDPRKMHSSEQLTSDQVGCHGSQTQDAPGTSKAPELVQDGQEGASVDGKSAVSMFANIEDSVPSEVLITTKPTLPETWRMSGELGVSESMMQGAFEPTTQFSQTVGLGSEGAEEAFSSQAVKLGSSAEAPLTLKSDLGGGQLKRAVAGPAEGTNPPHLSSTTGKLEGQGGIGAGSTGTVLPIRTISSEERTLVGKSKELPSNVQKILGENGLSATGQAGNASGGESKPAPASTIPTDMPLTNLMKASDTNKASVVPAGHALQKHEAPQTDGSLDQVEMKAAAASNALPYEIEKTPLFTPSQENTATNANDKVSKPALASSAAAFSAVQQVMYSAALLDEQRVEVAQVLEASAELVVSDVRAAETLTARTEISGHLRAELPRHIALQLVDIAKTMPDRPVELTLSPEELGKLRLTFSGDMNSMAVSVNVERPETLDLMRRHIDVLAQEMKDIGYGEVSFSFEQSGSDGNEFSSSASGGEVPSGEKSEQEFGATDLLASVRLNMNPNSGLDIRL